MALHVCRKPRGCARCEAQVRAQVREIRASIGAAWGQDDSAPTYATAGMAGAVGERRAAPGETWGPHPFDRAWGVR